MSELEDNLEFQRKISLVRLMMELRNTSPVGIVGLLETRNMLANLFPEFAAVRDEDVDTTFRSLAEQMNVKPEPPADPMKKSS